MHRVRERWVMRRTAVVNQIRSLLLERGLTLPKGRSREADLSRFRQSMHRPCAPQASDESQNYGIPR